MSLLMHLVRPMTAAITKQKFHVWLLPPLWLLPALYLAFQNSEKLSPVIFESFTGHWIRTWLDLAFSPAYVAVPLAAGFIECLVFAFVMDWVPVPKWIYAFVTPFILLGIWGSIPSAGSFGIFCILVCWGFYAIGFFSAAGGLTLKIIRSIRYVRV